MTLEGDIEMTPDRFSRRFASAAICKNEIMLAGHPGRLQMQPLPCFIHPEREHYAERLCRLLPSSILNCRKNINSV